MDASQSLLELVAAAQVTAKTSEDRIAELLKSTGETEASAEQSDALASAIVALEATAVDTFTLFEARMQHHFRRGPFSRKLKALLLESGKSDLADRVHQSYLAVNVLKHGKGASHRELLAMENPLFAVKAAPKSAPNSGAPDTSSDTDVEDSKSTPGLVDVGVPGFFEGLAATIVEAYHFLESKQAS